MKAITQPIIDFGLAKVVGGPPKHNSLEEIDFVSWDIGARSAFRKSMKKGSYF